MGRHQPLETAVAHSIAMCKRHGGAAGQPRNIALGTAQQRQGGVRPIAQGQAGAGETAPFAVLRTNSGMPRRSFQLL